MVEESLLEKQYHVNKVVTAVRVVGYHLVEGLAVGSTLNLPTTPTSTSMTVQVTYHVLSTFIHTNLTSSCVFNTLSVVDR